MKTKKASKTNARSRIIFFAIALTYNLLLGLYLKDFLLISHMLLKFYLLSALPTLFLLIDVRSKSMRAIIFVTLFLILLMDLAYILCWRCQIQKRTTPCQGVVPSYQGEQKQICNLNIKNALNC